MDDPVSDRRVTHARFVIVGTGFSGLGMAIALRKAGYDDFVILEKADDIGGTWRENTYPGCACDVPTHLYSYSSEPSSEWTRVWSGQPEILGYMKDLVERYDLRKQIHFGTRADGGHWDAEANRWFITTGTGVEYVCQYYIIGIGQLHIPRFPALPGIESFTQISFHSAEWNHEVDLTGKRVAVVGTGASAVQLIPEIVDRVRELHVYQRSAPWVLPRPEFGISPSARWLLRWVPGLRRSFRTLIYWIFESTVLGMNGHPWMLGFLERAGKWNISRSIDDPELRAALTPDYRIGCKRILSSAGYYPALNRPHVEVTTGPISGIGRNGVIDADGIEREVDAIIYATGFQILPGFQGNPIFDLIGVEGARLSDDWRENGIDPYLGMMSADFPNLFIMFGPNTASLNNSTIYMIEQQVRFIIRALQRVESSEAVAIAVTRSAQDSYTDDIQRRLAKAVWTTGGCTNQVHDSQGKNRVVWPGFTWQYRLRTRKLDPAAFELIQSGTPACGSDTSGESVDLEPTVRAAERG
ncbi:NAD(P)/FAD-dependent oxidoreductase [Nocardia yamanashiensis]|uniref:flavin-containing monooxygenase n=1 Tax=Nocardia yamanashiensis TaxID=209247 RepID=UPI001E362313|nr:NAD(P)/FAD-dependent oxidoreductase [Nocardia yamanashiensis]UGT42574.1 NAD(P)/FAD-dependent oxidoreductase [Nocardia yamanashiensis]